MIIENLGEVIMTAGFLLVIAAIFIPKKNAEDADEDTPGISELTG